MRNLSSTLAVVLGLVFLAAGVTLLGFGIADFEPAVATALKIVGGLYMFISLIGFIALTGLSQTFMGMNMANNWLHLVMGVGTFVAGYASHSTIPTSTKMRHV